MSETFLVVFIKVSECLESSSSHLANGGGIFNTVINTLKNLIFFQLILGFMELFPIVAK